MIPIRIRHHIVEDLPPVLFCRLCIAAVAKAARDALEAEGATWSEDANDGLEPADQMQTAEIKTEPGKDA
jgi:hypothetical protein